MTIKLQNGIIWMMVAVILSSSFLSLVSYSQTAKAMEPMTASVNNYPSDPSKTIPVDDTIPEDEIISNITHSPVSYQTPVPSNKTTSSTGLSLSDKIIINPSDQNALNNLNLANTALPDLKSDTAELARLIGRNIADLDQMRIDDWTGFSKIANDAETKYFTDAYLKQRLMASPEILAEMFNSNSTAIVQQMQTDQGKQYIDNAIQAVLDLKIDKRVIETLNYLVRPKDDPRGGAGHTRIQVDRIWNNYTRDSRQYSRESEVAEQSAKEQAAQEKQTVESYTSKTNPEGVSTLLNDAGLKQSDTLVTGQIEDNNGQSVSDFLVTDENSSIISAHHSGQAFDISQIDSVKCTLIKRRYVGKPTKIAQPPMNIKLLWQTTEGYNSGKSAVDSSFNSMFARMSSQSIAEMMTNLGIDFNSLNGEDVNSFGDIMSLLGQQFLADAIDAPTGSDIWKFNMSQILRKIGGVVIAEKLSLDRQPFLDSSVTTVDGLSQAIGRYSIEKKLNLPYGSLNGSDHNTILAQIGRARIIQELGLPEGSFPATNMNEDTLLRQIGSRIIESSYGLPEGSFNKANLAEVSGVISKNRISTILAFPTTLDVNFGLADGTTARLRSNLTLPDYLKLVAEAKILSSGYVYKSFNTACHEVDVSIGLIPKTKEVCSGDGKPNDKIFNLPVGTVDKFLSGTILDQDLIDVGIFSVSNSLEKGDASRANLITWLNNPNSTYSISTTVGTGSAATTAIIQIQSESYSSTLGIGADDLYSVFGSGNANSANAVYKRTGSSLLVNALRNSDYITKATQQALASNSALAHTVKEVEFYIARINTIKENVTRLSTHTTDLTNYLNTIQAQLNSGNLKADTDNLRQTLAAFLTASEQSSTNTAGIDQITTALTLASVITDQSGPLTTSLTAVTSDLAGNGDNALNLLLNKINAVKRDSELIAKSAYEMTTGAEQPNFRIEDMTLGSFSFSSLDLGGSTVGLGEFALFLSGQVSVEDFLLGIASAKLAGSLGLPAKALKYASIALQAIQSGVEDNLSFKDIFFRAVGMAGLEESTNVKAGSLVSPKSDLQGSNSIIKIRDGMMNSLKMTRTQANATLAQGLGLDGYNLDNLISDSFGAWSTARAKALTNDAKAGLPAGTTEKFITGKALGQYDASSISEDNIRQFSAKTFISEASIKAFIDRRDGRENPSIDNIYFVDQNAYARPVGSSPDANTTTCTPATTISVDQTEIIADNSFYYYDKDGQHVFNSYALANEYRKEHEDKKIDYITEIANSISWAAYRFRLLGQVNSPGANPGFPADSFYSSYDRNSVAAAQAELFMAKYPNIDAIKGALTNFASGKDQYAFGKDSYNNLLAMLDYGAKVPREITQKIFSRDISSANSISVDYLKISGYYILQNFAVSYLNNSLGMNIGSARITPEDVYSLFDGRSSEVFARVGGSIIDDTLKLQKGTTATILTATNSAQRTCAMDNAASQMLFDALGIRMDLTGLSSGGLGQGKLETFLNLPQGSFKGSNFDELLINLGSPAFAEAFQIPVPKTLVDQVDSRLKSIGTEFYNINASKNIYKKIAALTNYGNALGQQYQDIRLGLFDSIHSFLADPIVYQSSPNDSITTIRGYESNTPEEITAMVNNFRSRIGAIDTYMGFSQNQTARLLQDDKANPVISPDQYKNEITQNVLISGAISGALVALGWDKKGITGGEAEKIFLDFSNPASAEGGKPGALSRLFGFLDKAFSLNFDQGLGVPNNTIANVIKNPGTLYPTLYTIAGRKIDQMLGISSGDTAALGNQGVFEKYVYTYFTDDKESLDECGADTGRTFNECISARRVNRTTALITKDLLDTASGAISAVLSKAANIPINYSINGNPVGDPTKGNLTTLGVSLNSTKLTALFRGDLRVLEETGIIMGLQALYKGQGDQPYNMGDFTSEIDARGAIDSFRISNRDIELALYGDPVLEELPYLNVATMEQASHAVQELRAGWKKNLQYKTMDLVLHRFDPNVPPDFARRMYEGDGQTRTVAMLDYAEGFLNNSVPGLGLSEGTLSAIANYFHNPTQANLDSFMANQGEALLNRADAFFSTQMKKTFGIDLPAGTLVALAGFAQTGSLDGKLSGFAGAQSLVGLATDWATGKIFEFASKILKVPVNTLKDLDKLRQDLGKAYEALQAAKAAGGAAGIAAARGAYAVAIIAVIVFAVQTFLSDELVQMDTSLNLPPGTMSQVVGLIGMAAVAYFAPALAAGPVGWVAAIGMLLYTVLFGVYKVDLQCTADGYYPQIQTAPDASKYDNGNLGIWDGMNSSVRQKKLVESAQYKANKLVQDLYQMPARTGDAKLVPTQVMTGRWEDVNAWAPLTADTVCKNVGSGSQTNGLCDGTKAGMWANPQTTAYTHVGF